jgi:hypothetical protein
MRGEVFISPVAPVPADGSMLDPATARFQASWQAEEEPMYLCLEDVELDGAEAAIEWGRARSDKVWIRLGHRGDTYFSAGTTQQPDDVDDEPMPVWPPTGPPPGGWWEPPTVPTMDEIDRVGADVASNRLSVEEAVTWALDRLTPAIEASAPREIQAALMRLADLGPPGLHRFL